MSDIKPCTCSKAVIYRNENGSMVAYSVCARCGGSHYVEAYKLRSDLLALAEKWNSCDALKDRLYSNALQQAAADLRALLNGGKEEG